MATNKKSKHIIETTKEWDFPQYIIASKVSFQETNQQSAESCLQVPEMELEQTFYRQQNSNADEKVDKF